MQNYIDELYFEDGVDLLKEIDFSAKAPSCYGRFAYLSLNAVFDNSLKAQTLNKNYDTFWEGLKKGQVLELLGPKNSGKTKLLEEIIVTSILPSNINFKFDEEVFNIKFVGKDIKVLVFDLNRNINIKRLELCVKKYILRALTHEIHTRINNDKLMLIVEHLKDVILDKVSLVECNTSENMLAKLHKINTSLPSDDLDSKFKLVVVDDISDYYFLDKSKGSNQNDRLHFYNIQKRIVTSLHKLLTETIPNASLIVTNTCIFNMKHYYCYNTMYTNHSVESITTEDDKAMIDNSMDLGDDEGTRSFGYSKEAYKEVKSWFDFKYTMSSNWLNFIDYSLIMVNVDLDVSKKKDYTVAKTKLIKPYCYNRDTKVEKCFYFGINEYGVEKLNIKE